MVRMMIYKAILLREEEIPDFEHLQGTVKNSLSVDHHLKEKTKNELELILASGGALVAVIDESGGLVAQCSIAPAYYKDEAVPAAERSLTMVFGSYACLPEHRGKGVTRILLDKAFRVATERGFEQFWATVSQSNTHSKESLERLGFELAGKGTGKQGDLEYPVYYMKRAVSQGCAAASPMVASGLEMA